MKVLCIGDQHFQPSYEKEVNIFLDELRLHLSSNSYDLIISLGDLLHTHEKVHTLALNKAVDYFKLLTQHAKTFVLVGNHDYTSNTANLSGKHWLEPFKNWGEKLIIIDDLVIYKTLLFSPYVTDGEFLNNLKKRKIDISQINCIFAHQNFSGAKMGAIISENADVYPEEYPLVISGHIHDSHWVSKNVFYSGSAMQQAFGETADKFLVSAEISEEAQNKKVEINKIYLKLSQKKIIYLKTNEVSTFCENFKEEDYENTQLKLTITGSQEEFDAFRKTKSFKELIKKKIKINFKHNRQQLMEKKEKSLIKKGENFKDVLYKLITENCEKKETEKLKTLFKKIVST
jgi:DNA repair exonuclease SbcCD nuclease subunit